ncbi:family 16 glycoside hydrolase [Larkinella insperata]|uniref:Family 16 glycoside hydrolase n=1 Tax=Larkinella insperata TaxID=332158 RepID=A0ABW3Q4X3_9BACT|nr:family 16 glycoside hydrolase [Larkinella insperata]
MKFPLLTVTGILFLNTLTRAQVQPDNRLVAENLAQMPALDGKQLVTTMEALAAVGEKGLLEMALKLAPPGQGDNTSVQYALGGFSYYVTKPGKDGQRATAVRAYGQALEKLTDPESKAFIISQLQIVGKDDAVAYLKPYLANERLCAPAVRTLVKIGTPLAQKTLLDALNGSSGTARLSLVKALGDIHYQPAAAALIPLVQSDDKKLTKVTLYALARFGTPDVEATLTKAAQASGYTYDVTEATASYLDYLNRLVALGNKPLANALARRVLVQCTAPKQVPTRSALLRILVDINQQKTLPLLTQAVLDSSREYRVAALKLATGLRSKPVNLQLAKLVGRTTGETQADLITQLGQTGEPTLAPFLLPTLKSADPEVRLAAIPAVTRTGYQRSITPLLELLKRGTPEEVAAIKESLSLLKGSHMYAQITHSLTSMPAEPRVALLSLLGARAVTASVPQVLAQVKNRDTTISQAAAAALPMMVSKAQVPQLVQLLTTVTNFKTVRSLQQALVAATVLEGDSAQRTDLLANYMQQAPVGAQGRFLGALAGIGSPKALELVQQSFEKGDGLVQPAAVVALSDWPTPAAAPALLTIARQNNVSSEAALNGYLALIDRTTYPADLRLLMLRDAMDLARTPQQKNDILQAASRCRTFLALVFAGSYLTDPAVAKQAATTVATIANATRDLSGNTVRALLEKAGQVLTGSESEAQRQAIQRRLQTMNPAEGFVPLFNGKDLSGWKGLVADPIKRSKMDAATLAQEQQKADEVMRNGWSVKDGLLVFNGHGNNICTEKPYKDFEMLVDWKITKDGDAGIYLRGTPQVQIWDPARTDVGAQVGSGGLYNNQKYPSKPLKKADNPVGEWNTFRIIMKGERVTVYLNGELVTDNTVLENYWDRSQPIFPQEQIELQAHGTYVAYRNLYIRELPQAKPYELTEEEKREGYELLFNGKDMTNWVGNTKDYVAENGDIVWYNNGGKGNLYTQKEYSDFVFRFEFQLTPGANNGLGIRAPLEGDAAYVGMELQILDNDAEIYKKLEPYQYHGSVYGVIPARRGALKPLGEWNYEEVTVKGSQITVVLNGVQILNGDIAEASKNGTLDHKEHPGLKRTSGHIGFLGHGSVLRFRNIRVKDLKK